MTCDMCAWHKPEVREKDCQCGHKLKDHNCYNRACTKNCECGWF